MIRGIVFDIDDTLFLERDYVLSGFRAVARSVGRSDSEIASVASWLRSAFEAGTRGDTFDRLRTELPWVADRASTADLVERYRTHVPEIQILDGFTAALGDLRRRELRLGALSDGPLASQAAKARALELERWLDPIVLTAAHDSTFMKPGTAGFESIADGWRLRPSELAYVADNPAKDFAGPRALGWTAVRFRREGQLRVLEEAPTPAFAPDIEIHRPEDIIAWLDHVEPAGSGDDPALPRAGVLPGAGEPELPSNAD